MKASNLTNEEVASTVLQIVEGIEAGFICYLNPDTMEIEQVKKRMVFRPEEFEEQQEDMMDEYELDYSQWKDYIKFEPLGRDELYLIMESFISDTKDEKLSERLEQALNEENPIQAFKHEIENCDERNHWATYRHKKTIEMVESTLLNNPRMR